MKMAARVPRADNGADKMETDKLVLRWMKILGDRDRHGAFYSRHMALLLLGELGPQAKAAIPLIREVMAEDDTRLKRVVDFALAKIEK